jgi:hypothetical protein
MPVAHATRAALPARRALPRPVALRSKRPLRLGDVPFPLKIPFPQLELLLPFLLRLLRRVGSLLLRFQLRNLDGFPLGSLSRLVLCLVCVHHIDVLLLYRLLSHQLNVLLQ